MAWFYFFNTVTGRLVAAADVMPPTVPPDLSILTLADRAPDAQMWDDATRTFVPRPVKVLGNRLNDVMNDPDLAPILLRLLPSQRATLRTVIRRHRAIGTDIYNPAEPEKEPGI